MKIQFKFSVLPLLFLFAFQSLSYAATINWTGDVSSEWFNAGNWSGAIPGPGDDVIIPAGRPNDPVVEFLTQIASMVVESGATVTIISATLSINNASGNGLDNSGTIHNAASINIQNTTDNGIFNQSGASFTNDGVIFIGINSTSTGSNGILNEGTGTQFQNNNRIDIRQTDANALQNQGGAQFTNAAGAIINIGQTTATISGDGIVNLSSGTTFTNNGTILIDKISNNGIDNRTIFNNTASGTINIGQNSGNGGIISIVNESNTAAFTNSGTINIDNAKNGGMRNRSNASFMNALGANLNIGQTVGSIVDGDGISNSSSSSFINDGTITIDNTSSGISSQAEFDNTAGANIYIGQNDGNVVGMGLLITGASFTNSGTINIDDVAVDGIQNRADFKNAANATLNIGQNGGNIGENGIRNSSNTSIFTNEGNIQIDSVENFGVFNQGTFNHLSDTIRIANTGSDGINNNDTLTSAGVIVINSVGNNGISNDNDGVFTTSGTTNIDDVSVEGIENEGNFNNTANATINIGQNAGNIGSDGVFNFGSSAFFTNNGNITADNTSSSGIRNEGATFDNAANANINIGQNDGNIGGIGMSNAEGAATFTNNGNINIDNTSSSGLRNKTTFNNATNATINIGQNVESTVGIGISNSENSAAFTNDGDINIDNTSSSGIDNKGTFNNAIDATIDLGQSIGNIGGIGISNSGSSSSFMNNGDIKIDNTSSSGIRNIGNFSNATNTTIDIGQNIGNIGGIGISNSSSSATFTNSGIITIDDASASGVRNEGNFNNAVNATIDIGQHGGTFGEPGISNSSSSSSFMNNGDIKIDNTSSSGISNRGGFNNAINATIDIGQSDGNIDGDGIFNSSSSATFTNDGTINIDNTSIDGILNFSTFTNSNTINIDNAQYGIFNEGEFNNVTNANLNIGQNEGNIREVGIINLDGFPSVFFKNSGTITIDDPSNSSSSGITLESESNFIDSTGVIRLGQNHPFSGTALIIGDSGIFTGNDSTIIQCAGDFFIEVAAEVSGIGQLELEGDWDNNGTFSADSSLVTILGTTQSVIGGSSAITFFDLTINNSGDVVLERDVTVTRQLSLEAGQVNLGDNDFKLGDDFELFTQIGISALVTDGLGEIISTIANGESRIFPVGNNNYTPITIQNDGTSDQFSVQCLPKVLSDGTIGNVFPNDIVSTTWLIEEAVAGGANATLTAQWTSGEELPGFSRFNAFLSRYDGTAWDSDTPTSASGTDPFTISRSGVTTFSPFAVGTFFVPDFSCVVNSLELNDVALASDTYSTQQSIESTSLIEVGSTVNFIAANVIELKAGFHAESGSTFSAVIEDCLPPINNEEIIEDRTEIAAQLITRTALLFPNPVGQHLNIRDGIGQAMIYNMLGQQIQAFEIIDDLHTLDVSSLRSGQYVLLILRENGERVTLAFIK